MSFVLGSGSHRALQGVHPALVRTVERAITLTAQDFTVTEGLRSTAQQQKFYRAGTSQLDGVRQLSRHQMGPDGFGQAVDLVPYVRGRLLWDWDRIWPIAVAMAEAGRQEKTRICWGGNWYGTLDAVRTVADAKAEVESYKRAHGLPAFLDGPHYELVAWTE